MKTLFFALMIIFLGSCDVKNSKIDNQSTIVVTIDTTETDSIDNNLKIQLQEYLSYMNGENMDKAMDYCYPDLFAYMKREYPNEYSIEVVKENFRSGVEDMKKSLKKLGREYKFEVKEITQRVDLGERKIYSVVTRFITLKEHNEITWGEETLGITNDGGKSWKFLAKDSISGPDILIMKFPIEVVRKVFPNKKRL